MCPLVTIDFLPVTEAAGFGTVSRLAGVIWREHYPPIIGVPQVEYMLALLQTAPAIEKQVTSGEFKYFLLRAQGGEDIGYISITEQKESLFLSKFYLLKEHRGRGFAQEMMGFVEKEAKRVMKKRITLTTHKMNRTALRAYEKLGFKILGPVVTDIGGGYVMDDYRLSKNLGGTIANPQTV
jgi:diamine N-acetyltransferase